MALARNDKLLNNNFCVSLNLMLFGFSKVTNIQSSAELEMIPDGGFNDSPAMRLKPKSNVETIVLEKGIGSGPLNFSFHVGDGITAGIIMVMHNGKVKKTYGFEYGVVTKVSVGDLDAMGNQVLIERMEISHTGLITL